MRKSCPWSAFYFLYFGFFMCSCTNMTGAERHRAICNELRSQIVFNGGTSVTRQAEIQQTDQALAERSYQANDCDHY